MASMTRLEGKPNGKCRKWRFFASRGSGEGREQRSRRFEGTYSEAKAALADFEREFRGLPRGDAAKMTFREYADGWLERRRPRVADTSHASASRCLDALFRALPGSTALADVDTASLEDAYCRIMDGESASGKPLAPSYVALIARYASAVLADAEERGAIASNPARKAARPSPASPERVPPTAAEVSRLLAALDAADPKQAGVYLCASMGLRRGEALALRWGDVDGRVMHVRRTLRETGTVAPCKTGAGMRDLPIPGHVSDALSRRLAALEADMGKLAEAGVRPAPDTASWPLLAICADSSGKPTRANNLTRWWVANRSRFDMDCTLHDLRHAYLTACAVEGVPPKVMQALAGHASPVMTMRIYAHANMDAKNAAVEKIASVLHPISAIPTD